MKPRIRNSISAKLRKHYSIRPRVRGIEETNFPEPSKDYIPCGEGKNSCRQLSAHFILAARNVTPFNDQTGDSNV